MTLLDWLQSHPDSHVVSECFDVHDDLLHAKKRLGDRAHLLPMSDSCLLNFTLGLAINGTRPILQWPTTDLSSLNGWLDRIPTDFSSTVIIKVSCGDLSATDWSSLSHPKLHVWCVTNENQRNSILDDADGIVVLIESSIGMALNQLESRYSDLRLEQSSSEKVANPSATILVPNAYHSSVEETLDSIADDSVEIVTLHNLSGLDANAIDSIQRSGRVISVGLPKEWTTLIVQHAFWHLEAEPIFCTANTDEIRRALYNVWED